MHVCLPKDFCMLAACFLRGARPRLIVVGLPTAWFSRNTVRWSQQFPFQGYIPSMQVIATHLHQNYLSRLQSDAMANMMSCINCHIYTKNMYEDSSSYSWLPSDHPLCWTSLSFEHQQCSMRNLLCTKNVMCSQRLRGTDGTHMYFLFFLPIICFTGNCSYKCSFLTSVPILHIWWPL